MRSSHLLGGEHQVPLSCLKIQWLSEGHGPCRKGRWFPLPMAYTSQWRWHVSWCLKGGEAGTCRHGSKRTTDKRCHVQTCVCGKVRMIVEDKLLKVARASRVWMRAEWDKHEESFRAWLQPTLNARPRALPLGSSREAGTPLGATVFLKLICSLASPCCCLLIWREREIVP